MADSTIANLADGTTAEDADRLPVERSPFGVGQNRYITPAYIRTNIHGTYGTGVATALGVNVGSAGAFVTFNGALGTPSSGTLTNATGLPVSTGISGLGTNVATALGVNVGSAGAFVTFGGALGTPSSGTLTNATGLPVGGIAATGTPGAGNFLRGDGTWSAASGSGQSFVKGAGAPNSDHDITNAGGGGTVTFASKALTIAAGDQVIFEAEYYILNASGAPRNYTLHFSLGSFAGSIPPGNTFGASATNRQQHSVKVVWGVTSSSVAASRGDLLVGQQAAADTRGALNTTYSGFQWETSGSDLTGSQTASIGIASDNATATQTLTLVAWRVSVIPGV